MSVAAAPSTALPEGLAASLAALPGVRTVLDEPLARWVSMGIGGPADAFCRVATADGLRALLDLLAARGVRRLLVGAGTNLLPSDRGFRGVAVKLEGSFGAVEAGDAAVRAGAAAPLALLVERAMARDRGGLEFTTGIPGGVGGSLAGNAGTATEALGDVTEEVTFALPGGAARVVRREELRFGYRRSAVRELGGVVVEAVFRVVPRPRREVAELVRRHTDKRRGQPLAQPNVGCIFKNPPGESAGRLIDLAGLKGTRAGAVEVSPKHANFMVNLGGGRAADVVELVRAVRERVREASGIGLEPEVQVLDERGEPAC